MSAPTLPAREFLSTDDPDEAELALRETLCEHHISLRGPAADFHASVALAQVADLRIGHFRYGTALGITAGERTLQLVFHEQFSTTPTAYLKRMRLQAVHEALRCSSPRDTSVTRVAAEAGGFFHLGRFAGEYLAMFGEHPLDTLRSSGGGARHR